MNEEDRIQLKMNFGGAGKEKNSFRDHLFSADFSILFEVSAPSADSELISSVDHAAPLAEFAASCREFPCSLAFTDASPDYHSFPVTVFASALVPESGRGSHVIYLSGRGRDEESVAGFFAQCRLEGFRNVVCVSGMPSLKRKNGKVYESVRMLVLNRESSDPLFTGAVVNPYKYEICASLAQSFKLAKKARAGASFAVVQFGWDAAKLQEVSWQLNRDGCNIPLLARLMLMTPSAAMELCSDQYPGVRISRNFQNALRGEMQLSTAQFLAAQWRRFQLHAAGAKFLGYSGLQIGGVESASVARTAYQMILDAFAEFTDYQDWLEAMKDYYSQMDIVPYPWRYYLFDNLLQPGMTREDANVSRESVPELTAGEKFRYSLASRLFAKADCHPASERRLSKKLLVSCRGCGECRLPQSLFLCPESCPLGFRNGPCGEVDISGKCFLSNSECVHSARVRLAVARRDYRFLEETVV